MEFSPGMWLDPLLDSGSGFGAMVSENAFASADFYCREFPHHRNKEDPPIGFADVERSPYQGFWTSAAFYGIRMLLDA